MLGLVKGVVCDGVVTDGELLALRQWIVSHSEVCDKFPGNVIAARLLAAFADGVIDEEERTELKALLQDAVGETSDQDGFLARATRLPVDRPFPTVLFNNREFCFTGIFAYANRRRCEQEVQKRGGRCVNGPTTRTHYLVIGLDASAAWVGATHGTKIERAIHLKSGRSPGISIISEEHWVEALERNA
jgi:NAD-dependent DNA ligase